MSKKLYQDQEVVNLHQQYIASGLSVVSFAQKHNLSQNALRRAFKRLKLKIVPLEFCKRKFPVNDSFFKTIKTEEQAYVLGFIYADGCNHEKYHRLEISLNKQDEDILVKISKILLCGNINVKEYKQKKNKQNKVGLYVVSQQISDNLKTLGCPARKTFIIKFPILPIQLVSHFIRGYFDGDGMIVVYNRLKKQHKTKSKIAEFSITSTKEMLDAIGQHIASLNVNYNIKKRHKNRPTNNFTLRVFGNRQIKKVCDFPI